MKRNTYKVINETRGKINPHYDMTLNDIDAIISESNNFVERMCHSFILGYALGRRATKKEMVSR